MQLKRKFIFSQCFNYYFLEMMFESALLMPIFLSQPSLTVLMKHAYPVRSSTCYSSPEPPFYAVLASLALRIIRGNPPIPSLPTFHV